MNERTTDWAFTLLRPVLKQLKVQKLTKIPTVIKVSEHKKFIIHGMGRWIIIARQSLFSDQTKGCTTVAWDETRKLFLLQIIVDQNLFANNEHGLRAQRKMVAVHEFVHGSAHIFLSSFLKQEKYIEFMTKSIIAKIQMTTSDEFNTMLLAIGKLGTKDGTKHEIFSDGHFRLLEEDYMDGFDGNFAELYIHLLLSYQLVFETMTAIKIKHDSTGTSIDISELLTLTFNELVDKKALDREFVLGRMKLFLPMLFASFAK